MFRLLFEVDGLVFALKTKCETKKKETKIKNVFLEFFERCPSHAFEKTK